ncbi:hypothetical protein SCE1572_35280 [Sorangium cellulosum So0157-2]|uniref:Uncharacterized protein n=1 Tax=Sorangium cellulosum So0157-2 TaxID=1254432 RepID=S4Y1B1_SORCE|nr:hypothetical protein SCE1572_35280 [Sorangium cellulosum So0157-2]
MSRSIVALAPRARGETTPMPVTQIRTLERLSAA